MVYMGRDIFGLYQAISRRSGIISMILKLMKLIAPPSKFMKSSRIVSVFIDLLIEQKILRKLFQARCDSHHIVLIILRSACIPIMISNNTIMKDR